MNSRIVLERDVQVPMRDGTLLAADIFRPDSPEPVPALIQRTPYDKSFWPFTWMQFDPTKMAASGYAVIVQDVRGRFASQGDFYPYRHEAQDGFDTIAWAAKQSWCDGRVGGYGISYMAGSQWLAATLRPPALGALATATSPNDSMNDHILRGGALQLGLLTAWTLASIGPNAVVRRLLGTPDLASEFTGLVEDIDALDDLVRALPVVPFAPVDARAGGFSPHFDDRASIASIPSGVEDTSVWSRHPDISAPALMIAGWYDVLLNADLDHFAAMRSSAGSGDARRLSRIVIGPWAHAGFTQLVGELDFGLRSSSFLMDLREDFTSLHRRWFDARLKGIDTGIDDEPPVKYFVMGRNRWKTADTWPPAEAEPQRWHLHGDGTIDRRPPQESEPSVFRLDPDDPVPTHGGNLLMTLRHTRGPREQSVIERRDDVLVFTSDPLDHEVEIAGRVSFACWVAAETPDTDVVARLCDVGPDGRSYNVADGILRLRFRESLASPKPLTPGDVVRADVDLWSTAHVFAAGHRLRIHVCASDFPRYDRCPGTGESSAVATGVLPQRNLLFHDPARPSHLVLPVVG